MKKTVLFTLIILAIFQTDGFSQKKRDKLRVKADTLAVNDSLEYELIILDPGFDSWLATKPSKAFYSNEYYETRNRLYVSEWNQRYMSNRRNSGIYETYIDYNFNTDYGLDLNYKLYYYFKFFEETNHIRLIPSVR
jgi:hypothetical protein